MLEDVLYRSHPAMLKNHPVLFLLSIALIPVFGLGALILLLWYLQCVATTLIITPERSMFRKGILAKKTNEVRNKDVRNIRVRQTFGQRIFGVGDVDISSAGQANIEITAAGMPRAQYIAQLIREYQD